MSELGIDMIPETTATAEAGAVLVFPHTDGALASGSDSNTPASPPFDPHTLFNRRSARAKQFAHADRRLNTSDGGRQPVRRTIQPARRM